MKPAVVLMAYGSPSRAEDIPAYSKVRTRFLGEARPASMLLVIPQLVRPEFLVEVEIIAAKAEPKDDE